MSTAILIAAILAVKWFDYRQTRWIFGPGRALGFRELNPLITSEDRIVPVMAATTGAAVLVGLIFGDWLLQIFLGVSVLIVARNHWIGVRHASEKTADEQD